jgi:hypothetical protein
MCVYDPETAPDPALWLELDEQERTHLVEGYHRKARVKLPNMMLHAVVHTIVENQIAMEMKAAMEAMARLMGEGLSRHEAIHAIGCVLSSHLNNLRLAEDEELLADPQGTYEAQLEGLTVKSWHEEYGE